jgi:exopolysaccharide production protein ExoQ
VKLFQKLPEQIFAGSALFFYTGGIMPFISGGHPLAPLTLILPHLCTVATLLLLLMRWKKTILTIIREPLLWMMMAIIVISPFWSETPSQTWGEIAPLLRVTLFGLYLASRYSLKEILQIMGWAFGIAALLSFAFGAFLPSYGVMGRGYVGQSQDWTHEGSWRGIYVHKVVLGTVMTMSILVSLYLTTWKNPLRPLALAAIPLALISLLMSTTKAALLVLIVVLCCIPFYRSFRWKPKRLAVFLGVGLPLIGAVLSAILGNAGRILQALGKTTTLSGRTDIWPLVIDNIGQRPWIGYGYKTFWLNGWEGPAANVWSYLPYGFEPPHAHNGFLEILLSFGIVGFVVFVLNVAAFGYRAFHWARTYPTAEGLVPLLFLTLMLLINTTETMWMTGDVFWLCFVSISLAIAQKSRAKVHYELYPIDSGWENLHPSDSTENTTPAYLFNK